MKKESTESKQGKFMVDAQGNPVPTQYVKPYDRQRDKVARRVLARYLKAQGYLRKVKEETLVDIAALQAYGSEKGYRVGGVKGNVSFSSFDGLIRVRLDAREFVEFDARFREAQELIFDYLKGLTEKTDEKDIATIIEAAFKPSGRTGLMSRARIVGLKRLNITNPQWVRAMELMGQSEFVKSGKSYIYCETRANRNADYANVSLDIAVIDVGEGEEAT